MRIAYVLDRPELGGGVKVVFQHAQLLLTQGYHVTVLARGPKPQWIDFDGEYSNYEESPPRLEEQDIVIATYWTTVPIAEEFQIGPVVHFCQGYEADLAHLFDVRSQIEAVYQRRLPTLVVSPHLAEMLSLRFGRESKLAPPPLDLRYRPSFRLRPRSRPQIMIQGIFEAEVKGIRTALEAISQLKKNGMQCRVVRVSVLPLSDAEKEWLIPDRYLCAVDPSVVARELKQCDLLFFPSLAMEGFGLPLLEAMASKVPAVASKIPSAEFIADDRVSLVSPGDAIAFSLAAERLLKDDKLWRQARSHGYMAAQRFHPRIIAQEIAKAVRWAYQKVNRVSSCL